MTVALCSSSFDNAVVDGGGGASVLDMTAANATASSGISSVFEPAVAAVLTSNFCLLLAALLFLAMMCIMSLAALATQLVILLEFPFNSSIRCSSM